MYLWEIHNFHLKIEESSDEENALQNLNSTEFTIGRKQSQIPKYEFADINQKLRVVILCFGPRLSEARHVYDLFDPQALNCHTLQVASKFVAKRYEMPLRWFAWWKELSRQDSLLSQIFKLKHLLPWLVSSFNLEANGGDAGLCMKNSSSLACCLSHEIFVMMEPGLYVVEKIIDKDVYLSIMELFKSAKLSSFMHNRMMLCTYWIHSIQ